MDEKERKEEALSEREVSVLVNLAELVSEGLLQEPFGREAQDVEDNERQREENEEHHKRKNGGERVSRRGEGHLRSGRLTCITLSSEQKPSSRKVSMKARRKGPQITHSTIRRVNR